MTELTKKECKLVTLLKAIKGKSVWAIAIQNVMEDGRPWKIRQLIADLKSQQIDDENTMRLIIGQEAANILRNI